MSLRPIALAVTLACGALLAFGQPAAQAQGPMGGPPPGMGGGMRPGMRPGMGGGMRPNGRMAQALALTPAQQAKLKPLMDAQRTKMMALFSNTALSQPQKMQKMQAIRQSYEPKIAAILTPAQRAKMAAMRAQYRGGRPGGPGGPPPAH